MSNTDKKSMQLSKELPSSEEEIALVQIERLKAISRDRMLTVEETKMYDMFVKNLKLIQNNTDNSIPADYTRLSLDDQKLIEAAGGITTKKVSKRGKKKRTKKKASKNIKKGSD